MKKISMYRVSRYWNHIPYFLINLGRKMIWDQTGKNKDILDVDNFGRKYTQDIMCNRDD